MGSVGMSNALSEEKKQQVIAQGKLGWSLRKIERETGVRRETAGAYLKALRIAVRIPRAWGRRAPAKPANELTPDPSKPAGELKTFNVRVAIVEPGIIDTAMARRILDQPEKSAYRQRARFASLFEASLKNPVPPCLVAQKIVEIADSETWQLRHPVGPDAIPFLQWRSRMSDEEWVDLNASDDDAA
jgi:hypothetical protein